MKISMVVTSHDQLGDTGNKTGFWLEEFAAPYYTFLDAGAKVTVVSPKGGQPPLDPKSDTPEGATDATRRFKEDPAAQAVLARTVKLAEEGGRLRRDFLSGRPRAAVGFGRGQALDRVDRGLLQLEKACRCCLPCASRFASLPRRIC